MKTDHSSLKKNFSKAFFFIFLFFTSTFANALDIKCFIKQLDYVNREESINLSITNDLTSGTATFYEEGFFAGRIYLNCNQNSTENQLNCSGYLHNVGLEFSKTEDKMSLKYFVNPDSSDPSKIIFYENVCHLIYLSPFVQNQT